MMTNTHFKIAWRNLFKNKLYTVLNLVGLVSGIAFVLVISAYCWQEYQVNSDLRNRHNHYALQSEYRDPGMGMALTTAGPLPKALKEEYPNLVANFYRIDGISCIVSNGDRIFQEEGALGDSTILTMYGFELADGDAATALDAPFSVVITAATAAKYFGRINVVGETLSILNFAGEKRNFAITGVMKPMKRNSVINLTPHMDNTIFLPLSNADYFGRAIENWQNRWIAGFVELQEGVTPQQLTKPMKDLLARHADEQLAANLTPVLKPLSTYYLDDNNGAVRKMMFTLSLVAGFILLMAVINFVNITLSKSMTRLKEIGIRKVMGSSRINLTIQWVVESLVMVGLASTFALAIYPVIAPALANIMSRNLPSLQELPPAFYSYYAMGTFTLGIFAGIYPALRLSSIQVLQAATGQLTGIHEKNRIRKMLLGIQFIVAMVTLVSTVVISRQVSVFFSENLGYDKNYLITAQVPRDWSPAGLHSMETIRQQLAAIPQVESISISYDVPSATSSGFVQVGKPGKEQRFPMQVIISDAHYADTYNIPMLAGTFFATDKGIAKDTQKIVINERASRTLGYSQPADAIGQQITIDDGQTAATIAGVTADFYLHTMHNAQTEVVWNNVYGTNRYRYFSIRMYPGDIRTSLTAIEQQWKKLMPDAPFEFRFIDDTLRKMYPTEVQLQKASFMATITSILIVILGVIGLVSLTIQQRNKEIGIRRVLGATLINIVRLFVRDFLWVFVIALAIAGPIAYYMLHRWLTGFHLKTELDVWIFVTPITALSGLVLAFIALQSVRAAMANPVDALRDE